jgi:hypothetical protein
MKKLLCLGLFAVLFSAPTPAHAWECPGGLKVNGGCNIYLKVQCGNATLPLAPWYLYYPAAARFQPIGPAGFYPNWPQQPPPSGAAFGFPSPYPPGPLPGPAPQPTIQRTGYQASPYQNAAVPAYWYGQP